MVSARFARLFGTNSTSECVVYLGKAPHQLGRGSSKRWYGPRYPFSHTTSEPPSGTAVKNVPGWSQPGQDEAVRHGQIAAIAVTSGIPLITANPTDFKWFKGLTVHDWVSGQSV